MAVVENIFPGIGADGAASDNDVYTYDTYVAALIADAVDYDESQLSPDRVENMRYYDGEYPPLSVIQGPEDGDYEEEDVNRSRAVSTDVQDTVMAILPSLMRIFFSSDNVVDFKPRRADQVDLARQQTSYINYVFREENDGFLIMHNVFKDAMINRVGIVTWWTEEERQVLEREFTNVHYEDVMKMVAEWTEGDPGAVVEMVNAGEIQDGMDPETGLIRRVVLRYTSSSPCHRVDAVPPEEFRVDRRAKSLCDALLVGRDRLVTVSELVQKGYDLGEVEDYAGDHYGNYSEERQQRVPGIDDAIINNRLVRYGEYYIRADKDGDGIAELRHICVIGDNYHIISDEPADYVRYAVFCGDPTPHTVIGKAIADLTKQFQNINTQLLRAALDSISSSLFPDTYVNEFTVNLEDQLNDEVGKTVRVKGDPAGAIYEHTPNFIGRQVFEMMDQINMLRQRRTGISEASKGIDPKALQSTTLAGVDLIANGAQERIELIARIFAETGFKHLFKGLIREVCDHPNIKKTVEIDGEWVNVDHSLFDPSMRVVVSPTLGRGNDVVKMQALQQIQQTQLQIISQFGPGNTVVTPQEFMNTVEDMLQIAGIRNFNRYFRPITPEIIEQLQNAPKEPSPEQLLAQAEMEKVKAQTAKTLADLKQKDAKMALDEDYRRDKLGLDSLIGLIEALQKGDQSVPIAEQLEAARNTRDVQA